MIKTVMVDTREPGWVQQSDFGVPAANGLLDAGDVWVACDDALLVIERKTPSDLLNTLRDGRLFGQVAGMRQVSSWCYLVVTGPIAPGGDGKAYADGRATGWDYSAVQGALLTVQEMGCCVAFAKNDQDFVAAVKRIANRSRETVNIRPAREGYVLDPAEALLAALPGLGTEKVQAVLKHCGNAAWALSYLTTLGERGVPGIGDGTKTQVRKILGLKPNELITLTANEETAA